MLALALVATLTGLQISTFAVSTPSAPVGIVADDKPIKALEAWLKLYRAGKINYRSKDNISKDSIAIKYGIAPKSGLATPSWAGDLAALLEATCLLDTADAARALLDVAAVGLDQGKYEYEMAPYDVRQLAETWAAKCTSAVMKEVFAKAARGELKTEKAQVAALQAAGVRCLGTTKDKSYRPVLEQVLADNDEIVRVSAAEVLGALGDDNAAPALIAVVERESVDAVLIAAVDALVKLYEPHKAKASVFTPSEPPKAKPAEGGAADAGGDKAEPSSPPAPPAPTPAAPETAPPAELPESVRLAVRAAQRALGRTTWRADMALLRLLDEFRSLETVPALIGVLEHFWKNPDQVKSGKLSGLMIYKAHELLVSMTGAVHPADQPEKWRAFWDAEKDKISVTQKRPPRVEHTIVDRGFCGIPVEGTRVVFVVDLSGSMQWPMDEDAGDGKKKKSVRLDFAKRELIRAIDGISPSAQFNLITFNGNPKAEAWKPDMVPATAKNRQAFKDYVGGLRADGGTNLWSGLENALKIKSIVYGNRYTSTIDELFVLSDGAPTVGDVQDPVEILRLVQECNKFASVRINTIFISSATPPEARAAEPRMTMTPQELMRKMASENKGQFREL